MLVLFEEESGAENNPLVAVLDELIRFWLGIEDVLSLSEKVSVTAVIKFSSVTVEVVFMMKLGLAGIVLDFVAGVIKSVLGALRVLGKSLVGIDDSVGKVVNFLDWTLAVLAGDNVLF